MAPTSLATAQFRKYDVIIVGGGTAGLVAAARLSEDTGRHILVIEAGADRRGDPNIDIPGVLFGICGNPDYDWGFWTEPQVHIGNRELSMPRGKVLGGSSAINAMILVHPSPRNFESWTNIGNRGWTPDDMAPYFRKFHTLHDASEETSRLLSLDSYLDPSLHGTDGPLPISYPDTYGPIHKAFIDSFESLGINPDSHRRAYAASAYYTNLAEGRENVDLLTEVLVEQILFRKLANGLVEATGVQVHDANGDTAEIHAKEVILAAGAIHSPLVLENSGIGAPSILGHHGIEVLVANPGVGENLQDHPFTSISLEAADGVISTDGIRDQATADAILQEYEESQTGPLSGVALSIAFVPPLDNSGRLGTAEISDLIAEHTLGSKTNGNETNGNETHSHKANGDDTSGHKVNGNEKTNGIETDGQKGHVNYAEQENVLSVGKKSQLAELEDMMLDPGESTCHFIIPPRQMNLKPDSKAATAQAFSQADPRNFITFFVGLNHPLSRGSVHLRDRGHDGNRDLIPAIDPAVLSHPLDLEILARAVQFVDSIAAEKAMKSILKPNGARLPLRAVDVGHNLEAARAVTKERLWSSFHPSCTCAMMPRELGGVVSDRLLVYGTSNVRIIDASIFPMIPMGNLQSVVYAVAERACDLIKEDWASISA